MLVEKNRTGILLTSGLSISNIITWRKYMQRIVHENFFPGLRCTLQQFRRINVICLEARVRRLSMPGGLYGTEVLVTACMCVTLKDFLRGRSAYLVTVVE
eukprot:TRINITY_DN7609_c0_g1_i11.p6 TRINITY_DN7609_c0_g1~~TRINITY_DN7609_c0_g1_i11.p6  ORF type:complete len:100 (-),score=6.48 TRINITY_DN7609_c0_g1_i11:369-668(-)